VQNSVSTTFWLSRCFSGADHLPALLLTQYERVKVFFHYQLLRHPQVVVFVVGVPGDFKHRFNIEENLTSFLFRWYNTPFIKSLNRNPNDAAISLLFGKTAIMAPVIH
jgi:hypothetical protein